MASELLSDLEKKYPLEELQKLKIKSKACLRYFEFIKNKKTISSIKLERHKHWLRAAMLSLNELETPLGITHYWTQAVDQIVKKIWNEVVGTDRNLCFIALGKWGASVLNLSSDIDVIVVGDFNSENLKLVRRFIHVLSEVTQEGFIVRVDLDLRPGGASGPVITELDSVKHYLWSNHNEDPWVKLAYSRSRFVCGSEELKLKYFKIINKFCFSKYASADTLQNTKLILEKINLENCKSRQDNSLNFKLDFGGVRTVELVICALQVLFGGRIPSLRDPSFLSIFEALRRSEVVEPELINELEEHYWVLRRIENQLHSLDDLTQYDIASDEKNYALVKEILERNSVLFQGFFEKYKIKKFYKNQDELMETLPEEFQSSSLNTDQIESLESLKSKLLLHSHYFKLCLQHPKSFKHLVSLFVHQPYLVQKLFSKMDYFDLFFSRKIEIDFRKEENFLASLADYKVLNLLVALSHLLNGESVSTYLRALSETCDVIVKSVLQFYEIDLKVVAFGSWASKEMGRESDLDFIFTHDGQKNKSKNIKSARKFLQALGYQSVFGPLYHVDTRLSPQSSFGPVLTEWGAFQDFIKESAPLWQRQAYIKARNIGGDTILKLPVMEAPISEGDWKSLAEIKSKLLVENPKNLKYKEGGLLDLEFQVLEVYLRNKIYPKALDLKSLSMDLSRLKIWPQKKAEELIVNYFNLRKTVELQN